MLLIKDATLIEEGQELVRDVLLKDGKIEKIASNLKANGAKILDAKGKYLLPGIIDLNVHLKDNLLTIENIRRLINKAKRSGVTTFVIRSDFSPRVDEKILLELLNEKLEEVDLDIRLAIPALKYKDEHSLNDISILLDSSSSAIEARSDIDANLLRRILQYSLMKNRPFFVRCDNESLKDNGVMHEGYISSNLGLGGVSKIAEISEVAKVSQMALYYKAPTYFSALSTKDSLELVYEAKSKGAPIFSEVSILHLIFDDSSCDNFNTIAKIDPPLRDEKEKAQLIESLKSGLVDTITSLHNAQSYTNKDVAFADASFGADVLEYFLPLMFTHLVKSGIISFELLIQLISLSPARVLNLDEDLGSIEVGKRANLIIFDPSYKFSVQNPQLLFDNQELYGKVLYTIYEGRVIN